MRSIARCLALLAWSGIDYAIQRAHLASSLKMSKQEVRDESKETEGNPEIKGRIKRLQRTLRLNRRSVRQIMVPRRRIAASMFAAKSTPMARAPRAISTISLCRVGSPPVHLMCVSPSM